MGIKVIITGITGMVGEGILLECLQNPKVEAVLAVCRKPLDLAHSKLQTLLTPDFLKLDLNSIELKGYDACFYCAGVSSNGVSEEQYTRITFDTTIHFANLVSQLNPKLVFNFISGYQTDSSETGKVMWARVKGRTENALMKMFPERNYNFRPALMKPMPEQRHFYGYNLWMHKILYPVLHFVFPSCTIQEIAQAMINAATEGYSKEILEVNDIKKLAASPQ
ncbi:MAG: hypothetical protein JWQ35_2294 [Bacteriovoracaceae bacterium]|nr:hypothetical protein [Bacteriovoracaceae bacterium]